MYCIFPLGKYYAVCRYAGYVFQQCDLQFHIQLIYNNLKKPCHDLLIYFEIFDLHLNNNEKKAKCTWTVHIIIILNAFSFCVTELMVHAGQLEQDRGIKPRCVTDWRPSPRSTFLFREYQNGMNLESISGLKGISLTSSFVLFSVRQAAVTLSCADSSFDSNSLFSFSTFCFSSYSSSSWTSICFSWAHTK